MARKKPRDVVMLAMKAGDVHSAGTDFGFILTFRQPVAAHRLYESYCRLVEAKPAVRSTLGYDASRRRYLWKPLEESVWRALLAAEEAQFLQSHDLGDVVSWWRKPEECFPFLLARIDEYRYVASVQHTWNDGLGALRWVRALLSLYEGQALTSDLLADASPALPPRQSLQLSLAHTAWATWFLARRTPFAGRRAQDVVDLTHGTVPVWPNRQGFTFIEHIFKGEDFRAFERLSRNQGLSRTQYFCGILSQAFFTLQPEKKVARISMAVNLRSDLGMTAGGLTTGNYWSALTFEIPAGQDWRTRIRQEYHWLRRGIPASISRLVAFAAERVGDDATFVRRMGRTMERPHAHPSRGYLRQQSCVVSTLGKVNEPEIVAQLAGLTLYSKYELLSLSLVLFDEQLSLGLIAPNNLYNAAELHRLRDLLVDTLVPRV